MLDQEAETHPSPLPEEQKNRPTERGHLPRPRWDPTNQPLRLNLEKTPAQVPGIITGWKCELPLGPCLEH